MTGQEKPAAIFIQGKVTGLSMKDCVVVGGAAIVTAENSEVNGLAVESTHVFDSAESFLASLGLPPGGDYRGLADVLERTASDPKHEVSEQDKGVLTMMLGNVANLTTVVQAISAAAQSHKAALLVTWLRNTLGW